MGKPETKKEISLRDVTCLENLVVAYNTVFLMSSVFLVYIASTTHELFSDINRLLSPSLLLPVIGVFIVILAGLGYVGIAKQSSTLISVYTQLLLFIFALEIAAGLGVLSYRGEIRSMISEKMRNAIEEYPNNQMTANFVDYVQLELRCCGVNSSWDWENVLDDWNATRCRTNSSDLVLPESCCQKSGNMTMEVNKRGCLASLNFFLHKSSLLLTLAIITISTIQMLGAYFSYSLASALHKYKYQKSRAYIAAIHEHYDAQLKQNEKSNYF